MAMDELVNFVHFETCLGRVKQSPYYSRIYFPNAAGRLISVLMEHLTFYGFFTTVKTRNTFSRH